MEYNNDKLSARFVVPDKITVRDQFAYLSETIKQNDGNAIESLWNGARLLIQDWQCAYFPDMHASLADVDDPQIADLLFWAALEVKKHVNALEHVPKNS